MAQHAINCIDIVAVVVKGERGRAAPQRGERDKDFNITKICLKLLQEASWSGALGRLAGVLSRQGISR